MIVVGHPTVGVALFGLNVSDRLSSSIEELPVSMIHFTRMFVVGLAHRNVGWVARTSVLQVLFRVRY